MRKVPLLVKYIAFLLAVHSGYCIVLAVADETEERPVYTINPGDQLLIAVVGHENELTALVVVRPDGMVTYSVVGDIQAAGSTIAQLSFAIRERLLALGYYEDPQVTVQLRVPRREIIYVFGDVKEPGQKAFPESVDVIEALAAAGGYGEMADLANAKIIKNRKDIVPVDLEELLKKSIMEQGVINDELLDDRLMLKNGDVLIVPSAIKSERINIIGNVHRSGQYPVKSAVTLIKALALAGGPVEEIANLRRIPVVRADGSVVVVDATRAWTGEERGSEGTRERGSRYSPPRPLAPSPAPLVHPGDSVIVLGKGKVNVLGSVKNQGQFAVDGEISVIEALALAGIEKNANLKKLRILRSTGEQITVDASKMWKQRGREAEETLSPGDTLMVPSSLSISWSTIYLIVAISSALIAIFK